MSLKRSSPKLSLACCAPPRTCSLISSTSSRCSRSPKTVSRHITRASTSNSNPISPDADELVPEDGKDEVYDKVMEEIAELEDELDQELKKLEKKVGYVFGTILACSWCVTDALTVAA